jgi:hypothetical protein
MLARRGSKGTDIVDAHGFFYRLRVRGSIASSSTILSAATGDCS